LVVVGSLLWLIAPVSTAADSHFEVVASGLDNPRGLDFDSEGALYVVEAGVGGDGDCLPGPLPDTEVCFGATGAVTRVKDGEQERVVEGLPSLSDPEGGGSFAFGPHDISTFRDRIFVAIGLDNTVAARKQLGDEGEDLARLFRLRGNGKLQSVADLAAYEEANNPDDGQTSDGQPELRSNPNSILAFFSGMWVVDSGCNSLLRVRHDGAISTLAAFPTRPVEFPLGSGATIPMQAVPTAVAQGPDDALYVGELTGFPFPERQARIYRVVRGEEPEVFREGFTHIIGLEFDQEGNLYVLQIANTSLLSVFGPPFELATGSLIRISPDGIDTVLASEGLIMPTGLTIGPDGELYVSNCGVCADKGEVARITEP
jgi:hypothetical protein